MYYFLSWNDRGVLVDAFATSKELVAHAERMYDAKFFNCPEVREFLRDYPAAVCRTKRDALALTERLISQYCTSLKDARSFAQNACQLLPQRGGVVAEQFNRDLFLYKAL